MARERERKRKRERKVMSLLGGRGSDTGGAGQETPVSQTKGAEGAWRGRGCERKKVEAEVEVEEEVIPSWEAWRITARDRGLDSKGKRRDFSGRKYEYGVCIQSTAI